MSNQASEDDSLTLRRVLFKWAEKFNEMGEPNEGQDGWYIAYDKYMDNFMEEVQSLIRTEKLKLLDNLERKSTHYTPDGLVADSLDPWAVSVATVNAVRNKLGAEL